MQWQMQTKVIFFVKKKIEKDMRVKAWSYHLETGLMLWYQAWSSLSYAQRSVLINCCRTELTNWLTAGSWWAWENGMLCDLLRTAQSSVPEMSWEWEWQWQGHVMASAYPNLDGKKIISWEWKSFNVASICQNLTIFCVVFIPLFRCNFL